MKGQRSQTPQSHEKRRGDFQRFSRADSDLQIRPRRKIGRENHQRHGSQRPATGNSQAQEVARCLSYIAPENNSFLQDEHVANLESRICGSAKRKNLRIRKERSSEAAFSVRAKSQNVLLRFARCISYQVRVSRSMVTVVDSLSLTLSVPLWLCRPECKCRVVEMTRDAVATFHNHRS